MALPMAQLYLFCAKFFPEYKEFLVVKNEYSFSLYPPSCPALCPAQICCCSVGSQFSSVTQSCPTLCEPMDCSTPGFPVHHQFPELGQTHVHWVSDAVQPSHPLMPPSPPHAHMQFGNWDLEFLSQLHAPPSYPAPWCGKITLYSGDHSTANGQWWDHRQSLLCSPVRGGCCPRGF